MYRKLGIRDRILIDFFGWVTGIRLLNPSRHHITDEEMAVRKTMPYYYDEGIGNEDANLMDGGGSIH